MHGHTRVVLITDVHIDRFKYPYAVYPYMSLQITLGRTKRKTTRARTFDGRTEWGIPYSGFEVSVRGFYATVRMK